MFTTADLEAFKTPEEYATYQNEVRGRMQELDSAFAGRAMDEDARAEFASLQDLDKDVAKTITELQGRRDYLASLAKNPANVERPFAGRTIVTNQSRKVPEDIFAIEQYRSLSSSEPDLLQAYRDGAMFAVEHATYPNPKSVKPTEQAHIEKLLATADQPSQANPSRELSRRILSTGSPVYLRAFTKYLQGRMLSPEEQRAVAPWTVQTDATGGFAVPFYFDPSILHTGAWTNVNPYRAACTTKTIVGTDTYNGATTTSFTVARAGEAVAADEGLGAVGQITAIVGKVHGVGRFSLELLSDRPDITSEIAMIISEAKDTEEEAIFSVGAGDALGAGFNPIGMFGAAHGTSGAYTHIDTAAADGAVAKEDAFSMEAAVPIRHRSGAAWFMNRQMIRIWQALETTGGLLFGGQQYAAVGQPATNPTGNTGLRLIGYPIWETPSAPAIVLATNDLVVSALVDPKSYYIIERAGMSVEAIPHIFDGDGKPTGQRGIYAWWRNTAKPANVDAGRRLAFKA